MRTNELEPKEYREYIKEYITRVEKVFDGYLKFKDYSAVQTGFTEHHIFEFVLNNTEEIELTQEQIAILTEDDDSQPSNQYRIYFESLYIYSTRFQ